MPALLRADNVEFKVTFSERDVGDFIWQRASVSPEDRPEPNPEPLLSTDDDAGENLGLREFGSCSSENGEQFCEAVCSEVKVDQLEDGKLKMRCILSSS